MTTITANLKNFGVDRLRAAARNVRRSYSREKWQTHFVLSGGAILAFIGGGFVLEFFEKNQSLDITDPAFGIPFRFVTLLFGLLQLVASGFCLFTTRRTLSIWLVLWVVNSLLIYRLGMWWMNWSHPHAVVSPLAERFYLSVVMADTVMAVAAAYLSVGAGWTLLSLRLARRAEEFPKISCPSCGVHIRFAAENLGQSITCPKCRAAVTLRKPEEKLKMSCYFCQGRIEFPSHSVGEKLKCPHCNMDITLKEPVTV